MSYPRNATSPERVSVGAVVQISDGAVQTSGVAVKVIPFGAAEASGTGTVAYSADGVVLYTPTQGETNYTSFVLVASKVGCVPASTTVVTSAASVAGRTMPADGSITAAVIATDAIDADAIKADAVTEIQSGLATSTNVSDAQTAIIAQGDANETKIDAIQADTNDIQTRLPAALESGRIAAVLDSTTGAKIDAILEDTGTTLPAAIAAIDAGGSGTGARTVTITVNDGTTALQNATVRMTEGANTYTALTNASGVATFNLDDATYTVGVTKAGYTYAGTTLVVDGTETATYSMTQVVVSAPTNPALSAIEVLCLGADFTASSGIDIDFRMAVIPSSDQNNAFPGAKVTVTSDADGIARWEAPQGAAIEYKRGVANEWTRVTLDSDSVTNVTSVIGSP